MNPLYIPSKNQSNRPDYFTSRIGSSLWAQALKLYFIMLSKSDRRPVSLIFNRFVRNFLVMFSDLITQVFPDLRKVYLIDAEFGFVQEIGTAMTSKVSLLWNISSR